VDECSSCDEALSPDWRYCPACGTEQPIEACPVCKLPTALRWSHCPHCGEDLCLVGEPVPADWNGPPPLLRLLHLTDVHITRSDDTPLTESSWATGLPLRKRLRGILSLEANRVDHIVVTGDLTDSADDQEYSAFMRVMLEGGSRGKTTVIPGNHELVQGQFFSAADKAARLRQFRRWCKPFLPAALEERPEAFPFVRWLHDRVALIALDSTGEGRTLYNSAKGCMDVKQLDRLRAILEGMPAAVLKIVAIHHRLYPTPTRSRFLDSIRERYFMYMENADALRALLLRFQNVAVIHGHHHLELLCEEEDAETGGRLINLGAASSTIPDEEAGTLRYVLLEFHENALHLVRREYFDTRNGIVHSAPAFRRSFPLQPAAIPAQIRRVLALAPFRRSSRDRLELQRWRESGGASGREASKLLTIPGFLRKSSDKLSIRRLGFQT